MTYVILNGQILPKEKALISPEDRGFRFGDGVFETIRITGGKLYLGQDHLVRLIHGLQKLQIAFSTDTLLPLASELTKKNNVKEGILRIAISRGEGSRGYLPLAEKPTCYMTAASMPETEPSARQLIVSTYRRTPPESLPSTVKHANGLNSILARLEAEASQVDDAIMLSGKGYVSETSSANLFWQKNEHIYTPALSTGCLNGIMRQRFMSLISGIIECEATLEECLAADAIVMTNSAYYVLPVKSIESRHIDSIALAKKWRSVIKDDIACWTGN
ncbi:MAG: aminotransferase class IV [Rickettsiales bacterium]